MTRPRLALVCVLSLALSVAPLVLQAQHAPVYRVAVLLQGGAYLPAVEGLRDGLKQLGLEDGKQIVLRVRDARGDLKSLEAAAKSFEDEHVDLMYTVATSVTLAAKRATKRVPIVFYVGTDPVAVGLIDSYGKPGGRFTGVHSGFTDLTGKRLEILKDIMPKLRRVATFYDPANPAAQRSIKIARDAGRRLKVALVERPVTSVDDLRASLRALKPSDADALFDVSDAMVHSQLDLMIEVAKAKGLPAMLQEETGVAKGGLASYGVNFYAIGQLGAKQVQRILQGASPGDLPVEQLDRLKLVINMKTARSLGLTVPAAVLARADQVIE